MARLSSPKLGLALMRVAAPSSPKLGAALSRERLYADWRSTPKKRCTTRMRVSQILMPPQSDFERLCTYDRLIQRSTLTRARRFRSPVEGIIIRREGSPNNHTDPCQNRVSCLPRHRHHRLPLSRAVRSRMLRPWPRTRARARPSSMTAWRT